MRTGPSRCSVITAATSPTLSLPASIDYLAQCTLRLNGANAPPTLPQRTPPAGHPLLDCSSPMSEGGMNEEFAMRCWRVLDALLREALENTDVHSRDAVREAEEICWEFAIQLPRQAHV